MFKEGDLAEIHVSDIRRTYCMDESPAINLEGTIVRIKKVYGILPLGKNRYQLELVELHAKNPDLYEEYQMILNWQDDYLLPVENLELDTTSLFEGA